MIIDEPGVEVLMATLYLTEQYSVVKREGEALRVQPPSGRGQGWACCTSRASASPPWPST